MSLDHLGTRDSTSGKAETAVGDDDVAILLGLLLKQVKLLTARFEEAFDTKLTMEDIDED
jgi:hypothetical protein